MCTFFLSLKAVKQFAEKKNQLQVSKRKEQSRKKNLYGDTWNQKSLRSALTRTGENTRESSTRQSDAADKEQGLLQRVRRSQSIYTFP